MLARLWAAEAAFDELLAPYRVRADRIMLGMNLFLLLVCVFLTPLNATWVAVLLVGLPTVVLGAWLVRTQAGALVTRLFMACAFMVFTGLIIHQSAGDIEAHFAAFGLIGVLLYYRDWRSIVAATVFIYLHHLVLGYAQTRGAAIFVFDTDLYWETLAIHIAYFLPFVVMMGYLSVWLRREAYEARHVILLAQQIMRGDLTKALGLRREQREMPLISAVISMRDRLLDLMRVLPVPAVIVRMDTQAVVTVNRSWELQCAAIPDDRTPFGECPVWTDPEAWSGLLGRLQGKQGRELDKVEVDMRRRDGSVALCQLSLILLEDSDPVMAVVTAEDISQRRRVELEMQRLAYRDMLTDLPNRASLNREFERLLGSTNTDRPESLAVVMMDLDGFKPINDRLGHDAGDQVLRILGQRIAHVNRESDFAARLGGDEFVILMRNCRDAESAELAVKRLVDAISQPITLQGQATPLALGASAGVVYLRGESITRDHDAESLMKRADAALYRAKNAGRGRVVLESSTAI